MALDLESITSLRDAIRRIAGSSEGGASKTLARCVRVGKDGTKWVRVLGSDVDTPVNGTQLAEMAEGDMVEVSLEDGALSVQGNTSDPALGGAGVARAIEPVGREVAAANEAAEAAAGIASEASAVAQAVNQHFFTDTNGIHVTGETKEVWESDHSGPNILINSLGQLLRNGLNNLVSVTQSAIAFYDGAGNTAGNLVASFGGSGVMQYVGGMLRSALTAAGFDVYDADGTTRVAHFGEQAIIGRFRNGQALDKYLTVDYDALEFHDLGGTVMRVSGSTTNSLLSMASDMLRLYTMQIIGSSGLLDGLYAYLTNGFEFGSGGMEATDSGAHMTEIIAGRHWASDASKSDMAELWLFTTDGGVNPFAALQVVSGSNSIDFRLNASGSGTGMELDGVQVYPTHGSLAQDTNVASGGSVERTITFGHTYAAAPTVVATLYSTSTDAGIGKLSCVVSGVTTKGAKVKIFNNDSQTRAPGVRWIAIG